MSILDNLVEVVKFRIGLGYEDNDEIALTDVRLALQLALSAFNMVPAVTYFKFDEDEENIEQISDILVTYASYVLLTKKAANIVNKVPEPAISDGGISYVPGHSNIHEAITLARELWSNWDSQVNNLKQSDSFYADFVQEQLGIFWQIFMPEEITTRQLPHKKLAPLLEKLKKRVFDSDVVKDMLEEYDIDRAELDLWPICVAKIPVSARTDHGVIYLNVDLFIDEDGNIREDVVDNDHYLAHEATHGCQQTTGSKATPGSTDDNYLDNPTEQEGFQNQTKYISETQGDDEAEEYVEQVLDHHTHDNADEKKKEKRRKKLLG